MARRRRLTRRRILIALGLVIGIALLLKPLWGNPVQKARQAKAHADTHALANAVTLYRSHMGRLPASLEDLLQPATNRSGETLTAVLQTLPSAPIGYTPYRYEPRGDREFVVSTSGDGLEIRAP